jgi:hypothetical protein
MPTPAQQQLARKMDLLAKLSNDGPSTEGMHFEGTQWHVPARYEHDLEGAASDFVSMVRSYEENIELTRVYDFRPFDGAHATYRMLVDFFGYAQGIKQGKNPPSEVSVPVGYEDGVLQHISVPWGMMRLPLENATLHVGEMAMRDGIVKFTLTIQGKKKYHRYFDGFLNAVEAFLESNSIYAGKVVNGRFEFIDIERVDPSRFVYTEQTWAEAGVAMFSPLSHYKVITGQGLSPRRAVILEGAYGGGKTGMLTAAAKVAWANNWMAFLCEPGVDDPLNTLRSAFQYAEHGHRIFFACEDIDTFAKHGNDDWNTRLLDLYDSGLRKGYEIVMVATTNHISDIQKGMMRSGRIDAVIEVGPMDRPGVEKLCHIILGKNLAPDIDFDAVYRATEGYMPAFVKEGIERSLRFVIAEEGKVAPITGDALVKALKSLRRQHNLFEGATDRKREMPALDVAFRDALRVEVDAAIADTSWVEMAEQAIDNHGLPSADRVAEIVDSQIEYRLNGAVVYDEDRDREVGQVRTN